MVTFLLVPTFAISAFLVGVFSAAYAVPLPTDPRESVVLADRGCHQAGCLFVEPSSTSYSSTSVTTAASATATGSPSSETEATDTVENPPNSVEAVARGVGAARAFTGVLSPAADRGPSANQIFPSNSPSTVS